MGSAGITLSSRQPSAQRQAGLLAFGSTAEPPAFPGVNRVAEYKWQPASPITVAGPRGILTRFPNSLRLTRLTRFLTTWPEKRVTAEHLAP